MLVVALEWIHMHVVLFGLVTKETTACTLFHSTPVHDLMKLDTWVVLVLENTRIVLQGLRIKIPRWGRTSAKWPAGIEHTHWTNEEKKRGKIERRDCWTVKADPDWPGFGEGWKSLRNIAAVKRVRTIRQETSVELKILYNKPVRWRGENCWGGQGALGHWEQPALRVGHNYGRRWEPGA